MSLDYKVSAYKPSRPITRSVTNYGSMSSWMPRQRQSLVLPSSYGKSLHDLGTRPLLPPTPLGMPSLHDTYLNRPSPFNLGEATQTYRSCHDLHVSQGSNPLKDDEYSSAVMRHGRLGQNGSWRHLKEVMQAAGNRLVFVDGQIASKDGIMGSLKENQGDFLPTIAPNKKAVNMSNNTQQEPPIARYDLIDIRKDYNSTSPALFNHKITTTHPLHYSTTRLQQHIPCLIQPQDYNNTSPALFNHKITTTHPLPYSTTRIQQHIPCLIQPQDYNNTSPALFNHKITTTHPLPYSTTRLQQHIPCLIQPQVYNNTSPALFNHKFTTTHPLPYSTTRLQQHIPCLIQPQVYNNTSPALFNHKFTTTHPLPYSTNL
ncbi:hypothetical protein BgiBS90_011608 [Biomphalaria glabrata]|nr:hypothetical protein BgiBS90_011608 [Biomphalaria glabrata]